MKTKLITQSAIIAAIYIVLTLLSSVFGMSGTIIQLRLGEALAILPYFTPSAVYGLFFGCLISNAITGCVFWDIIFGSIATLIGAIITYLLRKKSKWLAPVGNVAANTVIIPIILTNVYNVKPALPFVVLAIFASEMVSCYVLGMILLKSLEKYKNRIF